ncbi:EF-hand calcium-binding domain-containing protein 14 isoform X6 [Nematostella vectensis]|uniref:EF-hand calcium-binding domain-containing protein 14 isoform X6 n=1 Tax=Nematostella vectensis TaxID=45351 RepID=UPI0020779A7D|nr:EF-hand calcium-binding domain-containing protein 14 isoform X6 [Nematostella vectensis]
MGRHKLHKPKTMKFTSRKNGTLLPDDDSDSDMAEFALPKKRILKPGKGSYVARRRAGCCRTCASIILCLILIASILCVVVLGWFSLRLKRDLDILKNRLAEVETSDRSTSKACTNLGDDLKRKLEALRGGEADRISTDQSHYQSLLRQVAHLNSSIVYINSKLKSPLSVSNINGDIELLKKEMADANREMTEVSDKVKQLRKIAHIQNVNLKALKNSIYNISVQFARISGGPTPQPVDNTATPPWLLRIPAENEPSKKAKLERRAEELRQNLTAFVQKEYSKIFRMITHINGTLGQQVEGVNSRLDRLSKNVTDHASALNGVVYRAIKKMETVAKGANITGSSTPSVSGDTDYSTQIKNLTTELQHLGAHMNFHNAKLTDLVSDVNAINSTLHKRGSHARQTDAAIEPCNCSVPLDAIRKVIHRDEELLHDARARLHTLENSLNTPTAQTSAPSTADQAIVLTTVQPTVNHDTEPTTEQPTLSGVRTSAGQTTRNIEVDATNSTTVPPTSAAINSETPTEKELVKEKRIAEENQDLKQSLGLAKEEDTESKSTDTNLFEN